jgi:hypothetical protein
MFHTPHNITINVLFVAWIICYILASKEVYTLENRVKELQNKIIDKEKEYEMKSTENDSTNRFHLKVPTNMFAGLMEDNAGQGPSIAATLEEDEHECKYCGMWTRQPDELCYKNPNK